MATPSAASKKTKNEQPIKPTTAKRSNEQPQNTTSWAQDTSNTTKIVVKCNCGFSNALFIRGEGIPGLSWDHGIRMKNIKADEWVWETDKNFKQAKFKILLNDQQYETGENHSLSCGKSCSIKPSF